MLVVAVVESTAAGEGGRGEEEGLFGNELAVLASASGVTEARALG